MQIRTLTAGYAGSPVLHDLVPKVRKGTLTSPCRAGVGKAAAYREIRGQATMQPKTLGCAGRGITGPACGVDPTGIAVVPDAGRIFPRLSAWKLKISERPGGAATDECFRPLSWLAADRMAPRHWRRAKPPAPRNGQPTARNAGCEAGSAPRSTRTT